jgi:hypothetical protein
MSSAKRCHPEDSSRVRDFDTVPVDSERLFLNEAKANPERRVLKAFIDRYRDVLDFFPEYADRSIVPTFGGCWSLPESGVELLTANGSYAVALAEERLLAILNFESVRRS